jgi:hypothetical protein
VKVTYSHPSKTTRIEYHVVESLALMSFDLLSVETESITCESLQDGPLLGGWHVFDRSLAAFCHSPPCSIGAPEADEPYRMSKFSLILVQPSFSRSSVAYPSVTSVTASEMPVVELVITLPVPVPQPVPQAVSS